MATPRWLRKDSRVDHWWHASLRKRMLFLSGLYGVAGAIFTAVETHDPVVSILVGALAAAGSAAWVLGSLALRRYAERKANRL